MADTQSTLQIGWATADLTPDEPVQICGQFHARVSEGILDPVTATALALERAAEDPGGHVVLVSCDLVSIPNTLRDAVRERVAAELPAPLAHNIVFNATHTHCAPEVRLPADYDHFGGGISSSGMCIDLPAMAPADYVAFAAERIADAVRRAWASRQAGSIGFGLGHAVVGRNRRSAYRSGESRMYGNTSVADFSHIEGYEDHAVNVLATWDADDRLTGAVVNLACPSQVSENIFQISADYWHETRLELRRRLGDGLFVLPQCSAAGDQSPHVQFAKAAEERMWRLADRTQRQEIACRIADAVTSALPMLAADRTDAPVLRHHVETVELPRRRLSRADVDDAMAEAAPLREEYERLRNDLEAHPEMCREARWYVPITRCYRRMKWCEGVRKRFELEQTQPRLPVELHAVRIGDAAIVTNPFEYYLDFGVRIKARSTAVQTFVVQLAGAGTYVPTERAIAGKSYGAVPASTPVGPDGGHEVVEWSVAAIADLWNA